MKKIFVIKKMQFVQGPFNYLLVKPNSSIGWVDSALKAAQYSSIEVAESALEQIAESGVEYFIESFYFKN
jgi:hypothetical protein